MEVMLELVQQLGEDEGEFLMHIVAQAASGLRLEGGNVINR